MGAQTLVYLLTKMSNEDRYSIGDDGLRDAMVVDNMGYVELGILFDPVWHGYGYEVTHIELYPREVGGKPIIKFMQMSSHFHSGMLKGYRFLVGLK
jgi:hypothetical protein